VRRNLWGLTWWAASVEVEQQMRLLVKLLFKENIPLFNELKDRTPKQSKIIAAVTTTTLVTPVSPALCWKKAVRRRKGGQHSVKKSVLFERFVTISLCLRSCVT